MPTFRITPSGSEAQFKPYDIEADTYEDAAHAAARRLGTKRAHVRRVTGTYGKSGVFQGYNTLTRGIAETSTGPNFHVALLS